MVICLCFAPPEQGEDSTLDLPWVGWDSDQSPAAAVDWGYSLDEKDY